MSKYINLDAFRYKNGFGDDCDKCKQDSLNCCHLTFTRMDVCDMLDDAPTIEIVRCKNCKYYWQSAQMCTNAEFPQSGTMMPYDFCSKGKPKEVTE